MKKSLLSKLHNMTEEQLYSQLYTHPVSGLLNRTAFGDHGQYTLLAMIDMDSLKYFNDQHGHAMGDALIKALGKHLVDCFGYDNVYHLSGDEFVVASQPDCTGFVDQVERAYKSTEIQFSYGTAHVLKNADTYMRLHKKSREQSGLRVSRDRCPPSFDISVLDRIGE